MNTIANQKHVLAQAQASSASYFFWIAGLTTISAFTAGMGYSSAMGMGICDVINAIVPDKTISIGFTIFIALLFVVFGWLGRTGVVAVFIIGMVLYALDAVLLAILHSWIGVVVHAFILYRLYNGVQYAMAHKKLLLQEQEQLRRQNIAQASSGTPN
jgi:hypothetical protein